MMKSFFIRWYEYGRSLLRRLYRFFIKPSLPHTEGNHVCVNLGCGEQSGPEYINVDIVPAPHIHYVHDIKAIVAQLLGQEPPYNNHYSVWNWEFIKKFFIDRGFSDVRRWDPKTAQHYSMHDRAERTLSAGGVLIPLSLNVETIK